MLAGLGPFGLSRALGDDGEAFEGEGLDESAGLEPSEEFPSGRIARDENFDEGRIRARPGEFRPEQSREPFDESGIAIIQTGLDRGSCRFSDGPFRALEGGLGQESRPGVEGK